LIVGHSLNSFPDSKTIEQALKRIEPFIHRTPVLKSILLNQMVDANLFFKCENFQKAGAFKSRGATNAIFSLSESETDNGVCTHSSGNHAAALSRAAALRNIKAYIVMPDNSSKVKIEQSGNMAEKLHFANLTWLHVKKPYKRFSKKQVP